MKEMNRDGDQMPSIVSVEWLAKRLGRNDIIIADCRFELADQHAGRRAYEKDHIPGALYFDLEKDLSRPVSEQTKQASDIEPATGGRHPLPSIEQMTELFGSSGIGDGVTVVCYDDQKGGMAGRLWWMLRFLGHQSVALLDGGYAAWREAGLPVSSDVVEPVAREFVPRVKYHMIATMDDVRAGLTEKSSLIIDSRDPERYRGEVEPLDPVAGHIPGSINMPWHGNVNESGLLLETGVLKDRFEVVRQGDDTQEIIVHCGSGVTGCMNVLAMERAGISGVRLYVGGWSDWCSRPDNPVE